MRIKGIAASKRIDVYIAVSKVIIEQKSIDVNLDKPQQGHNGQTPYEQAKFYNDNLIYNEKARWIIVSNFNEIRIYDMNDTLADPLVIMLEELPEKLSAFDILKAEKSEHIKIEEKISVKAGILVGKLYDTLINGYANPKDEETLRSLNQLCVRLVFCLYAEDAGVFSDNQFHNYLSEFQPKHIRDTLIRLFKILDTEDKMRDPDEEPSLLAFPYVNGGLFSDETIRIPIGFMDKNTIASDLVFLIPNAGLYEFGVLMSNVHNAWMRQVAGRLKSDYRYSKDIVYNCFPWCNPTDEQKKKIEQTAQAILDARALYPKSTLAELYDESHLTPELHKAHQNNDKAVMRAYGFDVKMSESEIVGELMKMYQKMTGGK